MSKAKKIQLDDWGEEEAEELQQKLDKLLSKYNVTDVVIAINVQEIYCFTAVNSETSGAINYLMKCLNEHVKDWEKNNATFNKKTRGIH